MGYYYMLTWILFGNIRIIRENFDVIILGAMGMFILPLIINLVKKRMSFSKEYR